MYFMNKDDCVWFKDFIYSAGYVPRSYSGRGMYGQKCLGVVIDNAFGKFFADLFGEAKYLDKNKFEVIQEAFNSMKTDSMGLGTIVYFENVEYIEEDS